MHGPFHVSIPNLPAGIAAESATKGDQARILTSGYATSHDGPYWHVVASCALDDLVSMALTQHHGINPFRFQSAFVRHGPKSGQCQVWLDIDVKAEILALRAIEKGQFVSQDDFAEIANVSFPSLNQHLRGPIGFIWQRGWQYCAAFDLESDSSKNLDIPKPNFTVLAAKAMSQLHFYDRANCFGPLTDRLYELGWFPFARIPLAKLKSLRPHLERTGSIAEAEEALTKEFDCKKLRQLSANWQKSRAFHEDDNKYFESFFKCFSDENWIAACSVLIPRVEACLRRIHITKKNKQRRSMRQLIASLSPDAQPSFGGESGILPRPFVQYLDTFFFRSFDESEIASQHFSRNTTLHGVLEGRCLTRTSCIQTFLILDQIFLLTRIP